MTLYILLPTHNISLPHHKNVLHHCTGKLGKCLSVNWITKWWLNYITLYIDASVGYHEVAAYSCYHTLSCLLLNPSPGILEARVIISVSSILY